MPNRFPHFARLVLCLAASAAVPCSMSADPTTVLDDLRNSELKQDQIRSQSREVAEQLDAMLAEFQANGISSDDVGLVKSLRTTLQRMSDKEMLRVIELLQQARNNGGNPSLKSAADAYAGQKTILSQFQQILVDYERNQAVAEVSQRFAKLAERQANNLQTAIELAKWTEGKKNEALGEAMTAAVDAQRSEQEAIAGELRAAMKQAEELAKKTNGDTAKRIRDALQRAKEAAVAEKAEAAAQELRDSKLFKALEPQRQARDDLRKLARETAPPKDADERLRDAVTALDRAADGQNDLVKKNQKILSEKPKDEKQQKQQHAEMAGQENQQSDLALAVDELSRDLQDAPETRQQLRQAVDSMQEAAARLGEENRAGAVEEQKKAAALLQDAKKQLNDAIAKAQAQKAGDALTQMQAIQKQVQDLMAQQDQATRDAAQPVQRTPEQAAAESARQQALQQRAAELARNAAEAPKAAEALNQAAGNMTKASQALQNPQGAAAAVPAQQQASKNLADANKQLSQALANLQNAQQQLKAADENRDALAALIVQETDLESETNRAVEVAALKSMAPRQAAIAGSSASLRAKLQPILPQPAAALAAAEQDMGSAKTALDATAKDPALQGERNALEDLQKALALLDEAAQAAQQALGQDPAGNEPLADAADALDDAKGQLDAAQDALAAAPQQPAPGQPAQNMPAAQDALKAAQKALAAAATQPGLPAAAKEAVKDAQKAASDAGADAAKGDAENAAKKAEAAEKALAQASSALAMAQAGMSSQMSSAAQQMASAPPKAPGQSSGPPKPNGPSSPNSTTDDPKGDGLGSGGALQRGDNGAKGNASYSQLPARDRQAIEQAKNEKYPEDFGTMVEQYMLNLADQ